MKTVMIALIATSTFSQVAHAASAVPSELIIGYDSEGKVDPGPQACLAHVKEVTEWDKAATERGAQQVCAVSAGCLTLGSNLIKDETTRFTKALTQGGFVP